MNCLGIPRDPSRFPMIHHLCLLPQFLMMAPSGCSCTLTFLLAAGCAENPVPLAVMDVFIKARFRKITNLNPSLRWVTVVVYKKLFSNIFATSCFGHLHKVQFQKDHKLKSMSLLVQYISLNATFKGAIKPRGS